METNHLINGKEYHSNFENCPKVHWDNKDLKKITRLRLLGDIGFPFYDVSYCNGVLKNGQLCDVILPFSQLPKKKLQKAIIEQAKKDKVYAKGLGLFDVSTISILI